jgi:hypothetical protein
MDINYCSLCGHENDPSAEICAKCSVDLSPNAANRPQTPVQGKPLLIAFGVCALVMLAAHFVEALEGFAFQWQAPETINEGTNMLVSLDSLSELVWPALLWFVGGAAMAFLARRAMPREGLYLGAGLAALQFLLWVYAANFKVGLLFSATLQIMRLGVSMALPSFLFAMLGLALVFLAPMAGAALGGALIERSSGQTRCPYCDVNLPTNPLPLACKYCHAPVPQPRLRWGWAWAGVALTALVFSLTLKLAGPMAGFYYRCNFTDTGESCTTAKQSFGEARKLGADNPWVRITDSSNKEDGFFVMYHTWKYTFYMALPFFIAPFLLAFFLQKGALPTAGMCIPFSWLVCMLLALLYFDLGSFEGSFFYSLRLHIVAFFVWGLAGTLGAMMGYRFGYSPAKAMMEANE